MNEPPNARSSLYDRGQLRYERRGLRPTPFSDFYHFLMRTTWRRLLLLFAAGYALVNTLFASLYLAGGPGAVTNAHPGSFLDAFWFSVQTFATIGYGVLAPGSTYAHVLVACESFSGMLSVALATGIVFAKFSRPTARVLFSRRALVCTRNGVPHLVFRLANLRAAPLVELHVKVHALIDEVSSEGQEIRRPQILALERSHMPMLLLSWNLFHALSPDSPLAGLNQENADRRFVSLLVTVSAVDETMVQAVHARHVYTPPDLAFDKRFVDIIDRSSEGKLIIDYSKFDDVTPDSPR